MSKVKPKHLRQHVYEHPSYDLAVPYVHEDHLTTPFGVRFDPAVYKVIPVPADPENGCRGCRFDDHGGCTLDIIGHPDQQLGSRGSADVTVDAHCGRNKCIFIADTPEAKERYVVWYFNAIVMGVGADT